MLRRSLAGRVSVATLMVVAVALPVQLATSSEKGLGELRAAARFATDGRTHSTALSLKDLDAADFKVLARPSRQSIVLGYPASKPCARTKLTLRLLPVGDDPLDRVRRRLPVADAEGDERQATGPDFSAGTRRRSAWRLNGDIVRSQKLVVDGVAALTLTKAGRSAIRELTLHGETIRQPSRCATGNRFTIGPALEDLVRQGGA